MDGEAVLARAEVVTTWVVLAPMAVGLLAAWAVGHVVVHLSVKALATGMDKTSRAGHRRYYRVGKEYRRGFHW